MEGGSSMRGMTDAAECGRKFRMQNAECKMQKEKKIQDRAFEFACRIVRLHQTLMRKGVTARRLAGQLLDSGTSVGSNLEEAEAGQSKADFISKSRIALKEARESLYWLRLFAATEIVRPSRVGALIQEAREIVAILTTIVRNASRPAT
jgi:four helix bundle protein